MLMLGRDLKVLLPTLAMFGVAGLRLLPAINAMSNSLVQLRFGRDGISRLFRDMKNLEQLIPNHIKSKRNVKTVKYKNRNIEFL